MTTHQNTPLFEEAVKGVLDDLVVDARYQDSFHNTLVERALKSIADAHHSTLTRQREEFVRGHTKQVCQMCNGDKEVIYNRSREGLPNEFGPCPSCHGTGLQPTSPTSTEVDTELTNSLELDEALLSYASINDSELGEDKFDGHHDLQRVKAAILAYTAKEREKALDEAVRVVGEAPNHTQAIVALDRLFYAAKVQLPQHLSDAATQGDDK